MKVIHQLSHYFLLCILFVYTLASYDDASNLNEVQDRLANATGLDLGALNQTDLPNAEEVEKAFKEKCSKNGAGEGAVDSLKEQKEAVQSCVEQYINSTVMQEELEVAKKTGSMDEVFGKYCKLYPEIEKCVENVTYTLRQCLDTNEVEAFNKSLEIVAELKEFACYKNGDRIAMFVAEGGPECIEERKDAIQICINETVGAKVPQPSEFSITNLPVFAFTDSNCKDFDKIRGCFNKELEKCENTTPANIVDAFFKFLKKLMPCMNKEPEITLQKSELQKSGSSAIVSSVILIVTLVSINLF